jgi:hypothetical protein
MPTSAVSTAEQVSATSVRFANHVMHVSLSDGREISVPLGQIEWLEWLDKASPEARERWSLEPGGYAIYWDELDDGVEVRHLLTTQPLA